MQPRRRARRSPHNISGSITDDARSSCVPVATPSRPGKMPRFPRNARAPRRSPHRNSVDGLAPHRQGKVRDIFDLGDSLLLVATDRISAFDYVLGSGIPDKGKVLTQLSAFWFGQTARHRAESPDRHGRRPTTRLPCGAMPACSRGRSMLVRKTRADADRVRRPRLSVGIGLEGISDQRLGVRRHAARGLRESDRLPQPIFTPATKATTGHDVNISEAEAGAHRRRGARRDAARADARALRRRRGPCRVARHHPGRYEVRVRPALPTDELHPHRRGADARFVALLAAGPVHARADRNRASTSSSSATTSRRSAGTSSPGALAAR